MLFIESRGFTGVITEHLDDDEYRALQQLLAAQPNAGSVMPGCGGLRKIRFRDPRRGKGRRGGLRIIYLHVPERSWIFLLEIYGKDEKEDLSKDEKKVLTRLATRIKDAARRG